MEFSVLAVLGKLRFSATVSLSLMPAPLYRGGAPRLLQAPRSHATAISMPACCRHKAGEFRRREDRRGHLPGRHADLRDDCACLGETGSAGPEAICEDGIDGLRQTEQWEKIVRRESSRPATDRRSFRKP